MALARPLRLAPHAVPKVWGGRALADLVEGVEAGDEPIGEVWVCSDREEHASVVADGPLAGTDLHQLVLREREALVGDALLGPDDTFPLLVKFIDAVQDLSVQVHPDARAAERLGAHTKDECWYVLAAEPDRELYLGLAEGVDARAFAERAATPDVVDLLGRRAVRAGDFVEVPAGTVHSIGAGVTLVEVQENSDTTYRVYDWDRVGLDGTPRETHLDEALASIDFETEPAGPVEPRLEPLAEGDSVNRGAVLSDRDAFRVELLEINAPHTLETDGLPSVVVVLAGRGELAVPEGEPVALRGGTTWLLPADLRSVRFTEADGELRLLRAEARRTNA